MFKKSKFTAPLKNRTPEPPRGHDSALENGLLNPRLSVSGRLSLDGWNGIGPGGLSGYRPDGTPYSAGHGRRSSLYRHQSTTLYDAFEEDDELEGSGHEAVGLRRLREESEEGDVDDDLSDVDERTRLRAKEMVQNGHVHGVRREGSRSHSNSPGMSPRPGNS